MTEIMPVIPCQSTAATISERHQRRSTISLLFLGSSQSRRRRAFICISQSKHKQTRSRDQGTRPWNLSLPLLQRTMTRERGESKQNDRHPVISSMRKWGMDSVQDYGLSRFVKLVEYSSAEETTMNRNIRHLPQLRHDLDLAGHRTLRIF